MAKAVKSEPTHDGDIPTEETSAQVTVQVPNIVLKKMTMTIVGESPLIMNKWSQKAKEQMLAKQMKQAKRGKEAKDPNKDYQESIYYHPDGGYGFPTIAFKSSAVEACRFTDGTKMTFARGAFHIDGEFAKIIGEPTPREDMVKIAMGTADIRYRAEFTEWKAILNITYNANALSEEQIVNLFNLAGFGVGVGEWRPAKDGQFGRFRVEQIKSQVEA